MEGTMKYKVIHGKDLYLFLITNKKNHAYSSQKEKKREALSLCIFTDLGVGMFFQNVNNSTL